MKLKLSFVILSTFLFTSCWIKPSSSNSVSFEDGFTYWWENPNIKIVDLHMVNDDYIGVAYEMLLDEKDRLWQGFPENCEKFSSTEGVDTCIIKSAGNDYLFAYDRSRLAYMIGSIDKRFAACSYPGYEEQWFAIIDDKHFWQWDSMSQQWQLGDRNHYNGLSPVQIAAQLTQSQNLNIEEL